MQTVYHHKRTDLYREKPQTSAKSRRTKVKNLLTLRPWRRSSGLAAQEDAQSHLVANNFDEYFERHYPILAAEYKRIIQEYPAALRRDTRTEWNERPAHLDGVQTRARLSVSEYNRHCWTLWVYDYLRDKEVRHVELTGRSRSFSSRRKQARIRYWESSIWRSDLG